MAPYSHESIGMWIRRLVIVSLLVCASIAHRQKSSDSLVVTIFDVGQGDSTLIETPGGLRYLVDAGGGALNWDYGNLLLKELTRKGILHLDGVVITHADADHWFGFRTLLRHISVSRVWVAKNSWMRSWPTLFSVPTEKFYLVSQQRQVDLGSVRLRLFSNDSATDNNSSIVIELEYAECRFLLPGDIEKESEAKLLKWFRPVQFLKVPHHGSRTSSTEAFLEKIQPRVSIVSAGYRNRYRHPHASVLNRLRYYGSTVLRTDLNGFVELRVGPNGMWSCRSADGDCGKGRCG